MSDTVTLHAFVDTWQVSSEIGAVFEAVRSTRPAIVSSSSHW
jgi:hypothetical protein